MASSKKSNKILKKSTKKSVIKKSKNKKQKFVFDPKLTSGLPTVTPRALIQEPKNCYEYRIAFDNHWKTFRNDLKNSRF